MHLELKAYAKAFSNLKRGVTAYGLAPHKPIFLLAIIDLMEQGDVITENKIFVNTQLVAAFLDNWDALVNEPFKPDFTQPFYYLQNERINKSSFWNVKPLPNSQFNAHIKSFNKLITVVDYGYFSSDLFILLKDKYCREFLKQTILNKYFPGFSKTEKNKNYLDSLSSDILNEPITAYKKITTGLEEEIYVRSGLFKKLIPLVYNQTCAFTGWKVQTASGLSLVDACHIKPFSICKEDHIKNGISLSPNIHRAFDRGILSLDKNYRILVSNQIIEGSSSSFSLQKLRGIKITLPKNINHYPGQEYLSWHRENCFKS